MPWGLRKYLETKLTNSGLILYLLISVPITPLCWLSEAWRGKGVARVAISCWGRRWLEHTTLIRRPEVSHVTRDSLHTTHHTSDIVSVIRSVNCICSSLSWQWRNIADTCHEGVTQTRVTELVTNMRPAHNTIVKTEWNNFRLNHFIVWVLINMFVIHVVIKCQWSKLPIKSHFQREKNIFYFPNTNSVHLAAIRILPQHDNGSTGSGYNFSCRSRRSQAVRETPTPAWHGLPGVSWLVETSLKYNPNLFSLH